MITLKPFQRRVNNGRKHVTHIYIHIYLYIHNIYYVYNNTNDTHPINYENTRKNTPCNAIHDKRVATTATTARRLYLKYSTLMDKKNE